MNTLRIVAVGLLVFVLALALVSFPLGLIAYLALKPYTLGHWWVVYKATLILVLIIDLFPLYQMIHEAINKRKGVTK